MNFTKCSFLLYYSTREGQSCNWTYYQTAQEGDNHNLTTKTTRTIYWKGWVDEWMDECSRWTKEWMIAHYNR